jgi:hypothetical protein
MMATGLWLLAVALFIAANPALEMLSLSGRRTGAAGELGGHRLLGVC